MNKNTASAFDSFARNLKRAASVALLPLALAAGGCNEQVDGGIEPSASALIGSSAIALKGSSLPKDTVAYLTGLGAKVQVDNLYVFVGNTSVSCSVPSAFTTDTCGNDTSDAWQFVLGLPPALQKVGTIDLSTSGVDNIIGAAGVGSSDGAATCAKGSAPNGLTGTIGISQIDDASVTISLQGNTPAFWFGSELPTLTAEYVAILCP